VSLYSDFTGAIAAWVTERKKVYDLYGNYLQLKWVVTKTGDQFLAEITMIQRRVARVSGTKGTDITNVNLNDLYAAEWAKVYGTKSLISISAHQVAADDTSLYGKWLTAKKNVDAAKKVYDDANTAKGKADAAKANQDKIKAEATTEKTAAIKLRGAATGTSAPAGATAGTGTAEALALATKADTDYRITTAGATQGNLEKTRLAQVAALDVFTKAAKASTDHAKLASVTGAYAALNGARDKAQKALEATQKAIKDDGAARGLLEDKRKDKVAKQGLYDKALTTCRNTKYDLYKKSYKEATDKRTKSLTAIKDLLEAKDKKALKAGATGARCEKALSQGNGRQARAKPCTAETDCCGAAKGPVLKLADWPNAPTMTIETCQAKTAKTYTYSPPRAPMQESDPADAANKAAQQSWPFACIAGASKLAAAATALATTAYMMA
jgi:hypothetical protein